MFPIRGQIHLVRCRPSLHQFQRPRGQMPFQYRQIVNLDGRLELAITGVKFGSRSHKTR
jgi:hypothetical protein